MKKHPKKSFLGYCTFHQIQPTYAKKYKHPVLYMDSYTDICTDIYTDIYNDICTGIYMDIYTYIYMGI